MASLNAFWSYVHQDDEEDGGRIRKLAQAIIAEFQLQTGEQIQNFFIDQQIGWGADWEKEIDDNLNNLAFCIPIVTPRFFNSEYCRRELEVFINRAEANGLRRIILPILYINVPALKEDDPKDPLVKRIKKTQWIDWRRNRLNDAESEDYRKGVFDIVENIVKANEEIEAARQEVIERDAELLPEFPQDEAEEAEGDSLGLLDLIPDMQEKIDELPHILNAYLVDMELVGTIFKNMQLKADHASGKSAVSKLLTQIALSLTPVTERLINNAVTYNENTNSVDAFVKKWLDFVNAQIHAEGNLGDSTLNQLQSLANHLGTYESAMESLLQVRRIIEPFIPLSRDLRPPLRQLDRSVTVLMAALGTTAKWSRASNNILSITNAPKNNMENL